jgi:type IV pilus modification protein PilV
VSELQINSFIDQTGFSMLEVLIASTVFSLGLAGLAGLTLISMNVSADARHKSYATVAAASLAEQIRLNPVALDHYLNPTGSVSRICSGESICTPEEQADYDFRLWQIELADAIKSARGLVCHDATPMDGIDGDDHCDGAGPLVIKIFWSRSGSRNSFDDVQDPAQSTDQHRYVLELS